MRYTLTIAILFLLLIPMYMVIGILIVMISGFPIVFSQRRVGKNGRLFTMYKFRTMIGSAEKKKSSYQGQNESDGPVFKIRNDPRFTGIGKFLSHTGFDELPQLMNVLRGEMSLIGPRPLPVSEAKKLKPWMRVREQVLPGIISPAILTGKYHKDFSAWMKSDVEYVKTKSIGQDAALLIRFVPFVCKLLRNAV